MIGESAPSKEHVTRHQQTLCQSHGLTSFACLYVGELYTDIHVSESDTSINLQMGGPPASKIMCANSSRDMYWNVLLDIWLLTWCVRNCAVYHNTMTTTVHLQLLNVVCSQHIYATNMMLTQKPKSYQTNDTDMTTHSSNLHEVTYVRCH